MKMDLKEEESEESPKQETILVTFTEMKLMGQPKLVELLRSGGKVFLTSAKMPPIRLTIAEMN